MNPYLQNLPKDIKGLILLPYGIGKYFLIIALIIIIICCIVVLILLIKKYTLKSHKENHYSVWKVLEGIEKSIEKLNCTIPFNKEAQIDFFYRLSLLLRMYLEHTTPVKATDLTYQEIYDKLNNTNNFIAAQYKKDILEFLQKGDLIKFSEEEISIDDAIKYKTKVKEIISFIKNQKIKEEQEKQKELNKK